MSNPNFNPSTSSDDIYFGQDLTKCLTDEVEGKSPIGHTHSDYAASGHNHNAAYTPISHITDTEKHVTAMEKAAWNAKADLVDGKVPISQIPDEVKEIRIVTDISARNSMTGLFAGLSVFVVDATADSTVTTGGAYYMYDGANWIKTAESESMDVVLQWANIVGKPESFTPAAHTHTATEVGAIPEGLMFTNQNGGVEYFYGEGSGKNLLTEIASYPTGFHTAYSYGGTEGNPKNTESWRIITHKTSDVIGWVLAFGTSGSIYSNYFDNGWKGWKCIYDALGEPLWTGEKYMVDTHTVTPTKALSECAHGWLLLWSDYNPGSGVGNTDFATTMISKFAYTGQKWAGGQWLCPVPRFADSGGESIIVKKLQVYDTKLVGHADNDVLSRNDVVLRAVYEF